MIVDGRPLEDTRLDRSGEDEPAWSLCVSFQSYGRNEFWFSFESTKYLYHGLDYESPLVTNKIIIKEISALSYRVPIKIQHTKQQHERNGILYMLLLYNVTYNTFDTNTFTAISH